MILPDVNTLLYAVNSSSDQHAAALGALRRGFDDPRGVALAWTALLAFLRLSTRGGVFPKPLSVDDGSSTISGLRGSLRPPASQEGAHPQQNHYAEHEG
jgi:uncharacterized protein